MVNIQQFFKSSYQLLLVLLQKLHQLPHILELQFLLQLPVVVGRAVLVRHVELDAAVVLLRCGVQALPGANSINLLSLPLRHVNTPTFVDVPAHPDGVPWAPRLS